MLFSEHATSVSVLLQQRKGQDDRSFADINRVTAATVSRYKTVNIYRRVSEQTAVYVSHCKKLKRGITTIEATPHQGQTFCVLN